MTAMEGGDGRALEELDRAECLRLLGTAKVGRLAFCTAGSPRIEVVNFVLDGDDPVFRIGVSSKLAVRGAGHQFALQADELDESTRTGWSVTVVGRAARLDPADVERFADRLETWAPGVRPWYVRVRTGLVFGRRITATVDDPAGAGI
jgi:nitroimidazol reductase NimA-like FMN-containing flavoprotein (pyridoxamine 5'-phosphate oxidase superfamily)